MRANRSSNSNTFLGAVTSRPSHSAVERNSHLPSSPSFTAVTGRKDLSVTRFHTTNSILHAMNEMETFVSSLTSAVRSYRRGQAPVRKQAKQRFGDAAAQRNAANTMARFIVRFVARSENGAERCKSRRAAADVAGVLDKAAIVNAMLGAGEAAQRDTEGRMRLAGS